MSNELFIELHRESKELRETVHGFLEKLHEIKGSLPELEGNSNHSLLDLEDQINHIEYSLRGRTYGRPDPLDFSGDYEYMKVADPKRYQQLQLWGECNEPGYEETAAFIGGIEVNLNELSTIKDWIEQVIQFHKKNPDRMGVSKFGEPLPSIQPAQFSAR